MVNPSIIPFNLHEMHLERLSKKVKFALIDRRNSTREQVPIGHFTMFKSLINGLMHSIEFIQVTKYNANILKNYQKVRWPFWGL